MAFENKLGITDSAQLAREEEKISKAKAKELFESGILDSLHPGTYVTPVSYTHLDVYKRQSWKSVNTRWKLMKTDWAIMQRQQGFL